MVPVMEDKVETVNKTELLKASLQKLRTTLDIWHHTLTMTVVFGISLSSLLIALVGGCVVLGLTIHFTNGYVMLLPDAFPHLYKAMPAWLGR